MRPRNGILEDRVLLPEEVMDLDRKLTGLRDSEGNVGRRFAFTIPLHECRANPCRGMMADRGPLRMDGLRLGVSRRLGVTPRTRSKIKALKPKRCKPNKWAEQRLQYRKIPPRRGGWTRNANRNDSSLLLGTHDCDWKYRDRARANSRSSIGQPRQREDHFHSSGLV